MDLFIKYYPIILTAVLKGTRVERIRSKTEHHLKEKLNQVEVTAVVKVCNNETYD